MSKKVALISMILVYFASNITAFSEGKFPISDTMVAKLSQVAREHITGAKLHDGSNVPAETPAEKAKPLIPASDARRVVEHGALSIIRETCNLDWKKDFFAFMDAERAKKIWSDKQMAYIGLVHGISMGVYGGYLKDNGGCTPKIRQYTQ